MSSQLCTQFSLDGIIHSNKSLWTPKVVLDFQPVQSTESTLSRLNKNDSADSNENGDEMPIEIRHLEDTDEMLFIPPLFDIITNNINYSEDQLSKSRSLNDISKLHSSPKERKKMKDQVRLHN